MSDMCELIEEDSGNWFDDAHDDLDLPPNATTEEVAAALEAGGWSSTGIAVHEFHVYER